MRSSAGVGMTPPNVLGAPKPTSSVMISRMLGACFGGTTRGAHHDLDCKAFSLMTPPNFGSGGGSCVPSIVVVAPGEPGVPLISWALTGTAAGSTKNRRAMATHANKGVPRPFEPQYRGSRGEVARIRKLVAEQAFRGESDRQILSSERINAQMTPKNSYLK